MKIAILHSTIRAEEKLLIEAAKSRNMEIKLIDIRKEIFSQESYLVDFDLALNRSVSAVKGLHAVRFFESLEVTTVNKYSVSEICADKFATSLIMRQNNIPSPKFALVFSQEQALKAIKEELSDFPVVAKPTSGSWGRLLAKINDQDALESIFEYKETLGSPQHKAVYLQEYLKKPDRDIRAFVIEDQAICAIYRSSPHWITNTARGAIATNCPISEELSQICSRASKAVGGGVLAMDLFETPQGLKINEINHVIEFRNSESPTKTSISGAIIDYCLKLIKEKNEK